MAIDDVIAEVGAEIIHFKKQVVMFPERPSKVVWEIALRRVMYTMRHV